MSLIARIFGLEDATESGVRLAKTMAVLLPSFSAAFMISTTFWMIYIAESLGGGNYILGLELVGVLVIIQLAVQTIFDYPTGALGDHIGQRWVIMSALFCYALGYYITSIVDQTSPFWMFALIYGLFGFGQSQESGAFNAWFDNNYRVAMPDDVDRKQYGVFMGKLGFVWQTVSTLVLIPGSWLALLYGRTWVFRLQSVFSIALAFAIYFLIRDLPGAREESESKTVKEYFGLMKDGANFLVSDRFIAFTIFGQVIMMAIGTVWWSLVLFPLYFSYLITDVAVSAYRTIVFVPQAASQERSGIWAKRFDPVKWIPRFRLVEFSGFVFYILLSITMLIFPIPDSPEVLSLVIPIINLPIIEIPAQAVIPMTIMVFIFVLTGICGSIAGVLNQRIMIDVIPNRIRNSMYSLQPTIAILCAMPLIGFFGWLLPRFSFPLTFALMGFISLTGALLIYKGFKYPIPKTELVVPASKKEQEEVKEMGVT